MDNLFNEDSGVMSLLSDFTDLIIANILWVITSLPIITLGASTAALYSVIRTPGEKRYSSSVFKNYFAAFGRNFKTATGAFLVLLIPGALVVWNTFALIFGLLEASIIGYIICGLSMTLFLFIWLYTFPLIACFENTVFRTLSNALLLSVAHFPTTLLIAVLHLIPVLVLLFFTNFFFKTIIVWAFVAIALIAKASCLLLERVFRRYRT